MSLRKFHIAFSVLVCSAFFYEEAKGQTPTPCFRMLNLADQPVSAGCIPDMIIKFVDCSVDGNGNPLSYSRIDSGGFDSHRWYLDYLDEESNEQNFVFGYFESDTFIITLEVSEDGINYFATSDTIIVYESPQVDMVATPSTGCNPLTVCFTNTSVSNNPITDCLWDFGGGNYSVNCNPCRTYTIQGNQNCWPVTLLVENALGCRIARTFPNAVCLTPPPVANFNSNLRELCDTPYVVTFTSTSVGANLAYEWDFGDSSALASGPNPTHEYDSAGNYSVTLTVTDTVCNVSRSVTRANWINAKQVSADFVATKTTFCEGECTQFLDQSASTNSPQYLWTFGWPGGGTTNQKDPNRCPPAGGPYNVTLTINDGGCVDSETKLAYITVNPKPTPNAEFTVPDASNCTAPFPVQFFVTNPCASCSYTWSFGDGNTGIGLDPAHTYDTSGFFTVTLEVTDNLTGCTAINVQGSLIRIENRQFEFEMDESKGCIPHTVAFTDETDVPLPDYMLGWVWEIGDTISYDQHPTYTFTAPGKYTITMSGVTNEGCAGTVTDTVYIGEPLTPSMTIDPNPVCVNEPVRFFNTTDTSNIFIPPGDTIQWYWEVPAVSRTFEPPEQIYDKPDTITIRFAAGVLGCLDTIEQQLIVLEPHAEFYEEQDCDDPGLVQFIDTSRGADTWFWDFGDTFNLSTNNSTDQHPTHRYTESGDYAVLLIVTSNLTGCTDSFTKSIQVSIIDAEFFADKTEACIGEAIQFADSSTGTVSSRRWDFNGEGTSALQNPTFAFTTEGWKTIKLVVTDINQCMDSVTRVNYIEVTGVTANFTASHTSGCVPPTGNGNTITFTSTSTGLGSSISTYYWSFGDSVGVVDSTSGNTVTHTYTEAGRYTVSLKVKTDAPCEDTEIKANYIAINNPVACFTTDDTLYCKDQPVTITNCSQGGGTYTWDLGDATTSNAVNIVHIYDTTGTYTITMHQEDALGCRDTAEPVTIRVTYPIIDFFPDKDTSYCPPHVACFTNLSNLSSVPIIRAYWDFGDGDTSDLLEPCHIYTRAGNYDVTLTVWFANQCVETLTQSTLIKVGGATGNIVADPDTGCAPMMVHLDANSQGAASLYWYFGVPGSGGYEGTGPDEIDVLVDVAGAYQPFVVLTDTQTPVPCSWVLYVDTIIVADSMLADFTAGGDSVCRADPIQFTDLSSTLLGSEIDSRHWNFGDGGEDTSRNPTHAFALAGWHTVTLTVTSKSGCTGTVQRNIYVLDKPTASFTVSADVGCDELIVTFTNTSTPGVDAPIDAANLHWDFGDLSQQNDTWTGPVPPPFHYTDTGAYHPYLVVPDLFGCDDTATVPINVYKTPDGIIPTTLQICEEDTVQLFTDNVTYQSYDWTPTDGLSDPTAQHPFAFPSDTITYTVVITEGHGCDRTDNVQINVVPLPDLVVTPHPSIAICHGDTIQFNASGANSYSWEPCCLNNFNIPNPVGFPPVTVDYIVTGTGIAGCKERDTIKVIVNQLTAQFVSERNCLGDSTNYIDQSTYTALPIVSREWDFGDASGPSTALHPIHLFDNPGTYPITLVVTDATGCTDTAIGTTIIDAPPDAAAWVDTTICLGDSVQIFASGGDTVFWTPGPYILNATSANPIVFPTASTTYIANVTNGVCPWDVAEVDVTVMPLPVVKTIPDTYVVRGQTVTLNTTADRYETVTWNPPDSLSCSNCLSPDASPFIKTTYKVTVVDEFGCVASDEVTIDADVECKDEQVWVANAFTPNGDGRNDEHLHA